MPSLAKQFLQAAVLIDEQRADLIGDALRMSGIPYSASNRFFFLFAADGPFSFGSLLDFHIPVEIDKRKWRALALCFYAAILTQEQS